MRIRLQADNVDEYPGKMAFVIWLDCDTAELSRLKEMIYRHFPVRDDDDESSLLCEPA